MKKILLMSLISLLLITGCASNKKIEKENNKLIKEVNEVYKKYANLDSLNETNLKAHIGLTSNDVTNYIGVVSELDIQDIYLIIKPKKGSEDRVKRMVNAYLEHYEVLLNDEINNITDNESKMTKEQLKKNYEDVTFVEIKGYYVYIISDSSSKDKILDTIKNNLK